jgi:hypothetical protein
VTSRIGTGLYEIQHANCSSAATAILTSMYSSTLAGYSTAYYHATGVCRVRTYTLSGSPADRSFSFWLPDASTTAWASISSTGTLVGSNDFGDQNASWSSALVTDGGGTFVRFDVDFPAWSTSGSVCVAGIRTNDDFMAGCLPDSGGVDVSTRHVTDTSKQEAATTVVFVQ